eukprot:TRINITY_DN18185_c0_g1_i1.p1 TRINITY_DN18185_c0_g1~~TRINITY_DN18185_c0_g1_i1.p1  ORF type:complete len:489 (+),score=73.87 TRINITY_DN18185_c0_g1_i1:73-1539(+)
MVLLSTFQTMFTLILTTCLFLSTSALDVSLFGSAPIYANSVAVAGTNISTLAEDFLFDQHSNSFAFTVQVDIDEVNEKLPSLMEVDSDNKPVAKDNQCLVPTVEGTIDGEFDREDSLVAYFGCLNACETYIATTIFLASPPDGVPADPDQFFYPYTFYLKKTCGGGPRNGLQVTLTTASGESNTVVADGVVDDAWALTSENPKPTHSRKGTLSATLTLSPGMGSQDIGRPEVRFSNKIFADPVLAGNISPQHLVSSGVMEMQIMLTCTKPGESLVTLIYPIGSFDQLEIVWNSVCEAVHKGPRTSISCSASTGPSRVIESGQTAASWKATSDTLTTLGPETDRIVFFFSDTGRQPLNFLSPVFTVEPRNILGMRESGTLVQAPWEKDTASLTLSFECVRSGSVGITVTVSMVSDYTPLQFSFIKECNSLPLPSAAPQWTAGRLLTLTMLFLAAIGCVIAYRLLIDDQKRYNYAMTKKQESERSERAHV